MTRAVEAPTWRWLAAVIAIGLLAGLARHEALAVGLLGDDFIQHAMLTGIYPGEGYAPFDLYALIRDDAALRGSHVAQGTAPWWSVLDADPQAGRGVIRFAVLRPLASALLTLDHALIPIDRPGAVWLWHLHSLAWFVAAVAAVGLALRRMFAAPIALVAVALFALDPAHVAPLAWLANRCSLICCCFGALAFWAHLRWRAGPGGVGPAQIRRRRQLIAVELACMTLALAGGEYGVIAAAYVLGWELAGPPRDPARARALALLPATIPVLIYLSAHQLLGYGTFGEVYADVFAAPSEWLRWATQRLPALWICALWSVPAGTSSDPNVIWLIAGPGESDGGRGLIWLGAGVLAVFGLAAWLARAGLSTAERRSLRGLALGTLLGLLPLTAAPAQARLLVVSQLGASALIAAVLVAAARLALGRAPEGPVALAPEGPRAPAPQGWTRRLAALPLALALVYAHTLGDLRVGQRSIDDILTLEHANLAALERGDLLPPDAEALRERDVVVLNSLNLVLGLHGAFMIDARGWAAPRSWRALAMIPHAMTATRLAPDTLELRAVQGAWLATAHELNFRRSDQPLRVGDVLERPGLRAEIIEVREGRPIRVSFRFDADLDDPRFLFVTLTRDGLERWTPPPLLGQRVVPLPRLPTRASSESK